MSTENNQQTVTMSVKHRILDGDHAEIKVSGAAEWLPRLPAILAFSIRALAEEIGQEAITKNAEACDDEEWELNIVGTPTGEEDYPYTWELTRGDEEDGEISGPALVAVSYFMEDPEDLSVDFKELE